MSPRRLGANGNVCTRPTSKVYTYIEKTYNLYINRRRHGVPSLSMHSIRETVGVADIETNLALFMAFFTSFRQVDDALCIT